MSEGIPEHVDLIRAAKQNSHYRGVFSIARMPRLCEYLANKNGQAKVDITLGDEGRNGVYLRGHAVASVNAVCQRCMQPMPYDIETNFELMLVEHEYQLEGVSEDIDTLLITEVPSSLISIIEDELILGFSLVTMHPQDQCEATSLMKGEQQLNEQQTSTEKENPFAVLKDFKIEG